MSKVSVLIPVFNEHDSVGELLNRVRAVPLETEVIVVDDHSTDGTAEVLAGLDIDDVVVVTHPENRGKGAAVRTALAVATGDVVVIQDADLEYSPSDLPAMIEPIAQGRGESRIRISRSKPPGADPPLGKPPAYVRNEPLVRLAPEGHGDLLQDGGS